MAIIGSESVGDGEFVIKFSDSGEPIAHVRFEEESLPSGSQRSLVASLQKSILRELRKKWNGEE